MSLESLTALALAARYLSCGAATLGAHAQPRDTSSADDAGESAAANLGHSTLCSDILSATPVITAAAAHAATTAANRTYVELSRSCILTGVTSLLLVVRKMPAMYDEGGVQAVRLRTAVLAASRLVLWLAMAANAQAAASTAVVSPAGAQHAQHAPGGPGQPAQRPDPSGADSRGGDSKKRILEGPQKMVSLLQGTGLLQELCTTLCAIPPTPSAGGSAEQAAEADLLTLQAAANTLQALDKLAVHGNGGDGVGGGGAADGRGGSDSRVKRVGAAGPPPRGRPDRMSNWEAPTAHNSCASELGQMVEVQRLMRLAFERTCVDAGLSPAGGAGAGRDAASGAGGGRQPLLAVQVPCRGPAERAASAATASRRAYAHRRVLRSALHVWAAEAEARFHKGAPLRCPLQTSRLCARALEALCRMQRSAGGAGAAASVGPQAASAASRAWAEHMAAAVTEVVPLAARLLALLDAAMEADRRSAEELQRACWLDSLVAAGWGLAAALEALPVAVEQGRERAAAGAALGSDGGNGGGGAAAEVAAAAGGSQGRGEGECGAAPAHVSDTRHPLHGVYEMFKLLMLIDPSEGWASLRPAERSRCLTALARAGLLRCLDSGLRALWPALDWEARAILLPGLTSRTIASMLADLLRRLPPPVAAAVPGSKAGEGVIQDPDRDPEVPAWEARLDMGLMVTAAKLARALVAEVVTGAADGGEECDAGAGGAAGPGARKKRKEGRAKGKVLEEVEVHKRVTAMGCCMLAVGVIGPAAPEALLPRREEDADGIGGGDGGGGGSAGGGGGAATALLSPAVGDPWLLDPKVAKGLEEAAPLARRGDARGVALRVTQVAAAATAQLLAQAAAPRAGGGDDAQLFEDTFAPRSFLFAKLSQQVGRMLRWMPVEAVAPAAPLQLAAAYGAVVSRLTRRELNQQAAELGPALASAAALVAHSAAHGGLAAEARQALAAASIPVFRRRDGGGDAAAAAPSPPDLEPLLTAMSSVLPRLHKQYVEFARTAADPRVTHDAFLQAGAELARKADQAILKCLGAWKPANAVQSAHMLQPFGVPPAPVLREGDEEGLPPPPKAGAVRMCDNPRCVRTEGPHECRAARRKCAGCRAVRYCCVECQRQHWRGGHRAECAQAGG